MTLAIAARSPLPVAPPRVVGQRPTNKAIAREAGNRSEPALGRRRLCLEQPINGADAFPEGGPVTDTSSSTDSTKPIQLPEATTDTPAGPRPSFLRTAGNRFRGSGRLVGVVALIAVAAVIGGAYIVGGPPEGDHNTTTPMFGPARLAAQGDSQAAATAAPVAAPESLAGVPFTGSLTTTDQTGVDTQKNAALAAETTQIVKTGQMTLEVTDLDGALNQAQATIAGMGGLVDQSNRSGTGEEAVASITFRFPVAKWDAALPALRKIGSKVLSEQTGSTDVTSQVIDLDARLDNLKTTEAALQAIMARATAIPDVIAVETQLSDTQGQIEQLTAQRDHLKDQAAMSTLTVTFQMPAKTVTTQATQDWTLGNQIDQAGAALVRIGQGLATMAVWIAVVALPLGLAVLLLLGLAKLTRRIFGRGRSRNAAAGA
jgi:hypothetical protein